MLVPAPFAAAVDTLRIAVGDGARHRIPPHLTLVPPVNVRDEHVEDAVDRLRAAASVIGPLRVTLGPPQTFLPDNPVLYLGVSGGDVADLRHLRDLVFQPPLERDLS